MLAGVYSQIWWVCYNFLGFPDTSVGKESACNAGDPALIPGLGRSAGEGMGYPLQYSRASLVAQLVKNPPTMRETWVWSLDWEDPLEKGAATHFSIPAWRIHGLCSPRGRKESDVTEWLSLSLSHFFSILMVKIYVQVFTMMKNTSWISVYLYLCLFLLLFIRIIFVCLFF